MYDASSIKLKKKQAKARYNVISQGGCYLPRGQREREGGYSERLALCYFLTWLIATQMFAL